jgi:hypothetical protein
MSGISVVGQQERRLDCAEDLFGKEAVVKAVVPTGEGTECESFFDGLLYF